MMQRHNHVYGKLIFYRILEILKLMKTKFPFSRRLIYYHLQNRKMKFFYLYFWIRYTENIPYVYDKILYIKS